MKKVASGLYHLLIQKKDEITGVMAIILFYVFLEAIGITCPLLFLTGISCAGCGMSRAWISLLRGDIMGAFHYHPLFLLPALFLVFFMLRRRLPGKLLKGLGVAAFLIMLTVYLARMMDPADTIVVFEPEEGFIYRTVKFFLSDR